MSPLVRAALAVLGTLAAALVGGLGSVRSGELYAQLEKPGWAPPGAYDQVVIRGDAAKREFIAFWLSDGQVLAGMNVNVWDVTEAIQKLIRSDVRPDPEALADPSRPLTALLE